MEHVSFSLIFTSSLLGLHALILILTLLKYQCVCTNKRVLYSYWYPYSYFQYFQLRANIYQARSLIGSDNSGLSDPFARVIIGEYCRTTQVPEYCSPTQLQEYCGITHVQWYCRNTQVQEYCRNIQVQEY